MERDVEPDVEPDVKPGATRRIRTAIVGAGKIAEHHLAAIDALPGSSLVGVCDANRTLAAFMTRRFGGAAFGDLAGMLEATRPDVLHVLTPAHLHAPMAELALDAGIHVLVEKPMALDRAERERMTAAAARADRILVEDHNYRFNRPMLRLQSDVAAGHLGDLVDVEVQIAMPLGAGNRYADPNLPSPSHRLPAGFVHEFITHLAYLGLALVPGAELHETHWSRRVAGHGSPYDELQATLADGATTVRLRFTALGPRSAIGVRAAGTDGGAEAEMIFGSYRIDRPRAVGEQLTPSVNALLGGLGTAARGFGYIGDRLRGRTAYEGLHELVRRFHHAVRTDSASPIDVDDLQRTGALVDDLIAAMPATERAS